jgi:hypothetical protein
LLIPTFFYRLDCIFGKLILQPGCYDNNSTHLIILPNNLYLFIPFRNLSSNHLGGALPIEVARMRNLDTL